MVTDNHLVFEALADVAFRTRVWWSATDKYTERQASALAELKAELETNHE